MEVFVIEIRARVDEDLCLYYAGTEGLLGSLELCEKQVSVSLHL